MGNRRNVLRRNCKLQHRDNSTNDIGRDYDIRIFIREGPPPYRSLCDCSTLRCSRRTSHYFIFLQQKWHFPQHRLALAHLPDTRKSIFHRISLLPPMILSFCLCVFVGGHDNSISCQRILKTFFCRMGSMTSNNWLDFRDDPNHDADTRF